MHANRKAHKANEKKYEADVAAFDAQEADDDEGADAGVGAGAGAGAGPGVGAGGAASPRLAKPVKPVYVPVDTLVFWRTHAKRFKYYAVVARMLLAIQIASAEVERLFSRGGIMFTARRNQLGNDKLEKLFVTAYNVVAAWKEDRKAGVVGSELKIIFEMLYPGCAEGPDFDEDE